MRVILHPLVRKDLRSVLAYYEDAAGTKFATRLYREFEDLVVTIEHNPRRFHPVGPVLRRANFPSFPFLVDRQIGM